MVIWTLPLTPADDSDDDDDEEEKLYMMISPMMPMTIMLKIAG